MEAWGGLGFWHRLQVANGGRSWSGGVALAQPLAKFLHPLRMLLAARRSASHLDGSPGVAPPSRPGNQSGTDALGVSPFGAAECRRPYRGQPSRIAGWRLGCSQ